MYSSSDSNSFIKEYLQDFINKEFYTKRNDIESNPSINQLSYYINKQIPINGNGSPNKSLNYMKVFYQNSSDLCGYHCLFYAKCYIEYILSNQNCYYLWLMNSCKEFWVFYKQMAYYMFNVYKDDEYLINELNKEGALEREQMNFVIENRSDLFPLAHCDGNDEVNFYYNTIDFICGQFSMEEEKAIRIQKVIENIYNKAQTDTITNSYTNTKHKRNVYLFFIGITNHWLLFAIDALITSGEVNYYVFDSADISVDVFKLNTLQEKDEYIEAVSKKEQEVYKKKPLTEYQSKSFLDWINDMKEFFTLFPMIINNYNNQIEYTLPYIILSKTIDQVISSYESALQLSIKGHQYTHSDHHTDTLLSSVFGNKDMTEVLLQLYMWLLSEYPPTALESFLMPKLTTFKLNSQSLLNPLSFFIQLNIVLIDKHHSSIALDDSEELFSKFKNTIMKIRDLIFKLISTN